MIDIDKFITSLLQWGHLGIPKDAMCFALKEQGLEFRDGSIKDILEDAVVDSNEDGLIADTIKQGEQKPAEWSEEDIETIERIVCILDGIRYYNTIDNKQEKPYQSEIDWLKSLRPQPTWKPSDEQMDALRYVTNFDYGGHKATLVSLYEQLKKLKG